MEVNQKMETDKKPKKKKSKSKKPKRYSENKLECQEYRLRVRAVDAHYKKKAENERISRLKWRNMTKKMIIQEELFFSHDIDFNRINFSDTPTPKHKPEEQPLPEEPML